MNLFCSFSRYFSSFISHNWYSRCSISALAEQLLKQALAVKLLPWTMTILVSSYFVVMLRFASYPPNFWYNGLITQLSFKMHADFCRDVYTQSVWILILECYLVLTAIELMVIVNLQLLLFSIEHSLY